MAADVLPTIPAYGSKRFSTENPVDRTSNALTTEVSASDREASVIGEPAELLASKLKCYRLASEEFLFDEVVLPGSVHDSPLVGLFA
jgi:hypothetical protein